MDGILIIYDKQNEDSCKALKIHENHVNSINLHDFVEIKIFDISNIATCLKDCNVFLNIPISFELYNILYVSSKPSIFINANTVKNEVSKFSNIIKLYNEFDTCFEQSWRLFNPKLSIPEKFK